MTFRQILVDRWQKISTTGTCTLLADMMPGTALVEIAEHESDTLVARGYASEITDADEQPPNLPALSAAELRQAITISKAEVYRAMQLLGLRYASKYQCIQSVQMGDSDWQVAVTFNGDFSCLFESVLQIYILKGTEEAHSGRLPKSLQRLDIDPSKLNGNSEIQLRLNLASGVLEGDGLYAFGVSTEQCPAELYFDSTPTALQFVPFGETKFQTVNEFLRVVVDGVLESSDHQKAGDKTELTLMELPNGPKTTDISNALVAAIRAATGVKSRIVKLTAAGTDPPGCKGPVPLLVTGPDTMMEAVCSLAVGLTDSLLAWSGERLSGPLSAAAGSKLAVVAEQRMGDEWLSLLRRATPISDADAVVVKLQPAMPPPPVVLSTTAAIVLVWRGIDEVAMQSAIAEAETRPYSDRARLVFILDDTAPPFSLSTALYGDQLARGARVNVLVRGGIWGCWRSVPVPKPLSPALSASSLGDVKLEFVGPNPLDAGSLSGHVDYVGVEAGGRRVFGVGQWLADYCRPRPDPLLRWPVPRGWSARDAATVPYVYSAVYYALKLKAEARRGESILVNEGASAIGQAAIRVASQLGCGPIYTTVRDAKQREVVRGLFPQLEPSHVLACGDGGSFEYRLRLLTHGRGVRLVVNTLGDSELRASLRCLSHWGRMLHYKREDMISARTIGSQLFLNSITLYGFSGSELFRGSERERVEVAEAMRRGLEDGTVQPIAGASVYDTLSGVDQCEPCTKAVIKVDSSSPSANQQCDPHKCYLVVGSQAADALAVAARLSTLGARQVLAAVGTSASAAAVRQQQRVLRRQNGTHLHVQQVRAWSPAAAHDLVKAAASVAPLQAAVVIVKDDVGAETSALLCDALPDAGLVLLAERADSACQLAALSSRRHGRHTACMAAAITDALDHLADLLCGASSSAVTVLPSATSTTQGLVDPRRWLPQTPAALSEVSQGVARCGRGPQLLELPSLARPSRALGESQPLFVLPPLGVLDAAAKKEVAGLAARLFSPVLVVEASVQAGVESTAKAIVKVGVHLNGEDDLRSARETHSVRPTGDPNPPAVGALQRAGLAPGRRAGSGGAAAAGGGGQARLPLPGAVRRRRRDAVGARPPGRAGRRPRQPGPDRRARAARHARRGRARGRHRQPPVGREQPLRVGGARRPLVRGGPADPKRERKRRASLCYQSRPLHSVVSLLVSCVKSNDAPLPAGPQRAPAGVRRPRPGQRRARPVPQRELRHVADGGRGPANGHQQQARHRLTPPAHAVSKSCI
ncbi:hypothetical protein ONE63_002000 [Megalurothrips usitatus]|uniref:Enoyl reductase (ER) domain-containing protein n=1 Tax=Megalurothrips usitatus TaxID=439358 RepID=A0AAV7XE44_9NEOP|nr:hypothetical protein ONE63_002000 [Megalurothrips usitatus]